MNVVKKRLVANEQVERDERFWNSTGDEFDYGVLHGVEPQELQGLTEGNEDLCDTCKWREVRNKIDCWTHIELFGYDDKTEPIVVKCNMYEKGDPISIDEED